MDKVAQIIDPKFIVSVGDNFQINGVQSTQDPLWLTTYRKYL